MAVRNDKRLVSAGPINPSHGFPDWFEDANGVRLAIVTEPDPMAPAIGELQQPGAPVSYPANFPEEAFYYMAEARLEVGGNGVVGRARVIMALEAAFGGDGKPGYDQTMSPPMILPDTLGVVFARFRVRIDDLIPGAKYLVRHPYGETDEFTADERGRIFETCDLGLAEGKMDRVLVTGEIAPFLTWSGGLPNGYIGDGVTEHQVTGGPFRNHVEIAGPRIGMGSVHAVGPDLVRTDLFAVQGRHPGTVPNAGPIGLPLLEIITAEYRTSRGQFRIGGNVSPISTAGQSNKVTVTIGGHKIGETFPDVTGAWEVRETQLGNTPPVPTAFSTIEVRSLSGQTKTRPLAIRN